MCTFDPDVDAGFITEHSDDPHTVIVEVDVSPAAYDAGHIPGAILWDAYTDLRHKDYRRVSDDEMGALLSRSGIFPDTTVVTYGYGAHLGYWLLQSYGYDRVALMDGPRDQWRDAGHAWSTDVPESAGAAELPATQSRFAAERDDVVALAGADRGVLLDVRSEAESSGARFWPSGAPEPQGRPGHIPGARHLPMTSLRTGGGRFVDGEELQRAADAIGIGRSDEIIVYCTIGNRASQAWYALTSLLDYENVRVFADSWVVWGMESINAIEQ